MAKSSGLAYSTLSVDDAGGTPRDIRNDITSLSWKMPRAVQTTTGIDKSAEERLVLLSDISYDLAGVFNTAANQSHAVLSTVASSNASRTVSNVINGATLGPCECVLTAYDVKRSNKGELTWDSKLMLQDGTIPTWS